MSREIFISPLLPNIFQKQFHVVVVVIVVEAATYIVLTC
jgi:hypothetical protein